MKKNKQKVVVAVSGGVDSSVTAKILKDQGYDVVGIFMRLFDHGTESERAARIVCKKLEIKFYPVNLLEKFSKEVKAYFLKGYAVGTTPNPCVRCNKLIKFAELLRIKNDLGADFLATGHYVRLERKYLKSISAIDNYLDRRNQCIIKLYKGLDDSKDQSYFLYNLTQSQLQNILFPLGEMKKDEVKVIAKKAGIPHLKTESQDVCFLVKNGKIIEHNDYLKSRIKLKPGDIKTMDNKVIGEHQGLPLYTLGQRRGVKIGGIGPFYVSKLDYKKNTLYVTNNESDLSLLKSEFLIKEVNWILAKELVFPFECSVVIRYRHKQALCEVIKNENDVYSVKLKKPERAVTPGQSAVFYLEKQVLGGGIIC